MRSIYLLTLLLLFSCEQQDSKSIVKKEIKYQLDSLEMNGYLVYDESIKKKDLQFLWFMNGGVKMIILEKEQKC